MKTGVIINCAASLVIEHFKNTLRGAGLTDKRLEIINSWNSGLADGARIADIATLEQKLKFPIKVKTVTDETLYDSGKYKSKGAPIELFEHNGHAWNAGVTVFPPERIVKIYNPIDCGRLCGSESTKGRFTNDRSIMDEIYDISKTDPVSVWLFASDKNGKFDQFVLPSGVIYRTAELQTSMKCVAEKYIAETCWQNDHIEELLCGCFTVPSVAAHFASQKNSWRPTLIEFLSDVANSCIEYRHGGLWNTTYNYNDVISVDMVACYPGSFLGRGSCSSYFSRFGHPTHSMTRVAINGELPVNLSETDLMTGFALVKSFEFNMNVHPIIPNWFGSHFINRGWAPIVLLRYMLDSGILIHLTVTEAIMSCESQKDIWLPHPRVDKKENSFAKDIGRKIIGKFTQGAASGGKRRCTRLIMDPAEIDFIINDTMNKGTFVFTDTAKLSDGYELGTIVCYEDGDSPQYTHLRSSMLAYVSINLLSMITRFSNDAVRVATDSFYIKARFKDKVEPMCDSSEAWGSWRIKNEQIHHYSQYADYNDVEYHSNVNESLIDQRHHQFMILYPDTNSYILMVLVVGPRSFGVPYKDIASFFGKFLEDIINHHGTIDRVWLSPGHVFISVQEGRQLLAVDAQRVDSQRNDYGDNIILDTGSKLLDVLKGVPLTVYTVQSNGCVQCWSFKQDSGWSLSQRFDICNAPTAEVGETGVPEENDNFSQLEKLTIGDRTLKTNLWSAPIGDAKTGDLILGPASVLIHNCPSSQIHPLTHGVFITTDEVIWNTSITLLVSIVSGKVTAFVRNTRHDLPDISAHDSVEFSYIVSQLLHVLCKQSKPVKSLSGWLLGAPSQSLCQLKEDGCLLVVQERHASGEIKLENFENSISVIDAGFYQGFLCLAYRKNIRIYSPRSGKFMSCLPCPTDEEITGLFRTLHGCVQMGFHTKSHIYLIQVANNVPIGSCPAVLLESSKFQTDAIHLAHLDQIGVKVCGSQIQRKYINSWTQQREVSPHDYRQQKNGMLKSWEDQKKHPISSKLAEIVDPLLTEYWKLEQAAREGLDPIKVIPNSKPMTVTGEVIYLLDFRSPMTHSNRQAQLLSLSSQQPQEVLDVLLSYLDIDSEDDLSTYQLQKWLCILTEEGSEVSTSCDLAIPLFEQICHLLFTQHPSRLLKFVKKGQMVCDQRVGVSAFIRKRQTLQVYERALKCIPDPEKSCHVTEALDATVELLIASEQDGSKLKAQKLLLRHRQWLKAQALLSEYQDNSSQHILMYQITLDALIQNKVLAEYSDLIFSMMPKCQSIKSVLPMIEDRAFTSPFQKEPSASNQMDTEKDSESKTLRSSQSKEVNSLDTATAHAFCKDSQDIDIASVRSHLNSYLQMF